MIIDFSQVIVLVSCDYFKGSLSLYVLVSVSEATPGNECTGVVPLSASVLFPCACSTTPSMTSLSTRQEGRVGLSSRLMFMKMFAW